MTSSIWKGHGFLGRGVSSLPSHEVPTKHTVQIEVTGPVQGLFDKVSKMGALRRGEAVYSEAASILAECEKAVNQVIQGKSVSQQASPTQTTQSTDTPEIDTPRPSK